MMNPNRSSWLERDPLVAERIRSLRDAAGAAPPIEVHRTVTSTQDRLRELEAAGAPIGAAVFAEEQTAGRGRRGAAWISEPGLGLWGSVLAPARGASPGVLTLGVAVAVRRAIERAGGPRVAVKWPNDLEVGGRKVCGIVFEVTGAGPGALGIGINVHHAAADFPAALAGRATSLDLAGDVIIERNRLAARLLDALAETHAQVFAGGGGELLDEWRAACAHLGRVVRVVVPDGELTGTAVDIDGDGALRVQTAAGEVRTVLAGTLRYED